MGYNVYHPHIVDVEGQNPSNMRKCRYYRLTQFMQKFMDKEIATLLKLGFIEPSSSSWRSPALLVKKPNDNLSAVEIKDFEIFLFSNDKRFSVTRENMGYNVYHPHIVDVEGQNPSNMRKCRYYRLTPFMQKFMDKEIATF